MASLEGLLLRLVMEAAAATAKRLQFLNRSARVRALVLRY